MRIWWKKLTFAGDGSRNGVPVCLPKNCLYDIEGEIPLGSACRSRGIVLLYRLIKPRQSAGRVLCLPLCISGVLCDRGGKAFGCY